MPEGELEKAVRELGMAGQFPEHKGMLYPEMDDVRETVKAHSDALASMKELFNA